MQRHLLMRHKDTGGRGEWDLVSLGSFEPLTVAVIEPGKETVYWRSEPGSDGFHQLAVGVRCHALVFVNGITLS
jgi:hypothetical protein